MYAISIFCSSANVARAFEFRSVILFKVIKVPPLDSVEKISNVDASKDRADR